MVERRREDEATIIFRREVLRRLEDLEREREDEHRDNLDRLSRIEQALKDGDSMRDKIRILLDDWTGGDEPELGMRRILKQIITERQTLGFGWKVLIAIGSVGATLIAAYTAVTSFLGGHPK